jgi:Phage integrase, N-terminal SAM-like domain
MDKPARSPLARSFERHMRAENRSDTTIATCLHGLRQAEAFLRARGTTVEAATRADLEAFMADLLARRTASTAATYYKVLKVLYGWLVDEEELDADPMAKMKPPIVPINPVPVVPADGLKAAVCHLRRQELRGPPRHRAAHAAAGHRRPPRRDGRAQAHRCRSANAPAIPRPKPRLAPTTTVVLPDKSPMIVLFFLCVSVDSRGF